MRDVDSCAKCEETGADLEIVSCPICYKGVCRRCAVSISGRPFCSQVCADYFFHGDEEDSAGHSDE